MPFLERANGRVYYDIWGEGEGAWVTLVNGFSRSSSDFRAMARSLVARGFHVLTFDNRGAGQTECPLDFTLDTIVDDIEALWNLQRISTSHVLGISYGGVISLRLVLQRPKRVRSLALVSTTASSQYLHVNEALLSPEPSEIETALAKYFSQSFATKNPFLFRALVKETARVFLDSASREKAKAQRRALERFDFTSLLPAIAIPTLVVHGDEDRVIDVEAAKLSGREIPNSRLEILPGAGHLLLAEMPKRLYEIVLRFYEEDAQRG